jgi:hypothetical protein
VAIVVASVVLGTAHSIVTTIADSGDRVSFASVDEDAAFAGQLLLRSLVSQARTLQADSISFLGSPREFVVRTWCPVVGGWSERCDADFAIDDSTRSLMLRTGAGAAPVPLVHADRLAIRYLASAADGGRWVDRWSSAADLPVAIGVIADQDTLILPVGR